MLDLRIAALCMEDSQTDTRCVAGCARYNSKSCLKIELLTVGACCRELIKTSLSY